jgi:hypothetical protein
MRSATATSSVPVLVQARSWVFQEQKLGVWHMAAAGIEQSYSSRTAAPVCQADRVAATIPNWFAAAKTHHMMCPIQAGRTGLLVAHLASDAWLASGHARAAGPGHCAVAPAPCSAGVPRAPGYGCLCLLARGQHPRGAGGVEPADACPPVDWRADNFQCCKHRFPLFGGAWSEYRTCSLAEGEPPVEVRKGM